MIKAGRNPGISAGSKEQTDQLAVGRAGVRSDPSGLMLLAEYASALDATKLPSEVLKTAKACLLYGLAVGIATKRAKPALAAAAASKLDGDGNATSTRLIDGARVSHGNAAFANAVLLSGRAQGDSHPCGHLGGVVIPSALAAAEDARASGARLLSAMIAGYEVALRIGRDHAADLSTRGFRTTPCYGVFGSVVAGGRIKNFQQEQMTHAIGLAANFAGGLREYVDAGTEDSPFQAGFAARNGLYAADIISCGIAGAPSALHGKAGFYQAFGASAVDYGRRLGEGLGSHFEFTNVTFKEYPACQFLRGIIRGLSLLRAEAGGASPVAIELRMNPFEADFIGVRYRGPFNSATQTVMSAPFCGALAWATGTASFQGLRDFDSKQVLELIPRVRVIADESRRRYEPLLRVMLDSGSALEWQEKTGDSGYRISWESAERMTYQLCDEVEVPRPLARSLVTQVASVDELASVEPLISAVCAATLAK